MPGVKSRIHKNWSQSEVFKLLDRFSLSYHKYCFYSRWNKCSIIGRLYSISKNNIKIKIMILEKLGMVFIMLIIVAIIVGVICFITYVKDIEYRVRELERRNEREDDERWNKMIKKVEQDQDSQPKV